MSPRVPISRVTLGGVSRSIYDVPNPSLVPKGYLRESVRRDEEGTMRVMRWMMTKVRQTPPPVAPLLPSPFLLTSSRLLDLHFAILSLLRIISLKTCTC